MVCAGTHGTVDQCAPLRAATHQAVTLGRVTELVDALVAVPEEGGEGEGVRMTHTHTHTHTHPHTHIHTYTHTLATLI